MALLLAIISTAVQARTNSGAEDMMRELRRFCSDKELKVCSTHYNTAIYSWYFKYLYEVSDTIAPPTVPKALRRLTEAFGRNADKATNIMFLEAGNTRQRAFPLRDIVYMFPDGKKRYNGFRFILDSSKNYYSATFDGDDGMRSCYQLVWKPEFFADKDNRLFCAINGSISVISSTDWEVKMARKDDEREWSRQFDKVIGESNRDTINGDIMVNQIKTIAKKYSENTAAGDQKMCDAIALLTDRLSKQFDGTLTLYQYKEVADAISGMIRQTDMESKRIFHLSVSKGNFRKKSEAKFKKPWNTDNSKLTTVIRNRLCEPLHDGCYSKLVEEVFDYKPVIAAQPIIKLRVSGTSRREGKLIGIRGSALDNTYGTRTREGKFGFSIDKLLGTIITIYDDQGNEIHAVADTVPLVVDMEHGILSGSETNMRFQAVQERIKALQREAKKYIVYLDGNVEVTDSAGFFALLDTLAADVVKAVKANCDNEIPAYLLYSSYQKLSFAQLSECMDSTKAYSRNLLMQPVWDYYEGLKKRQPGLLMADFECEDASGKTRRLSDYTGKGYVLLDFWSLYSYASRNGFPEIKQLNKRFGDKGLTVVSVALFNIPREVKEYTIRRDLDHWPHLAAPEGFDSEAARAYGIRTATETVIIGPDGKIVASGLLEEKLTKKIEELMESLEKADDKR